MTAIFHSQTILRWCVRINEWHLCMLTLSTNYYATLRYLFD